MSPTQLQWPRDEDSVVEVSGPKTQSKTQPNSLGGLPSIAARLIRSFDRVACDLQRDPTLLFAALFLAFVYASALNNQRPLWYDELIGCIPVVRTDLFTLLFGQFAQLKRPALYFFLVHPLGNLFGESAFVFRLPALIGFLVGSFSIYLFLLRAKVGRLFCLTAVVLFWTTPAFYYATEARPYGVIVGFAGLVMLSWQHAASHGNRRWSLIGLAAGEALLALCHPLTVLILIPLVAAECARYLIRRKKDWQLWTAVAWPVVPGLIFFFFHIVHPAYSGAVTAKMSNGSVFYQSVIAALGASLVYAGVAVRLGTIRLTETAAGQPLGEMKRWLRPAELTLLSSALLIPFAANGALLITKSYPYFWRYAIIGMMPVPMLAVYLLGFRERFHPRLGLLALITVLACFYRSEMDYVALHAGAWIAPPLASADELKGKEDLPLVVASGLTFMEMIEREPAGLLARTYYLSDPQAALQYADSMIFEDGFVKDPAWGRNYSYVPVPGIVAKYADFTRHHKRFLVLGTPNYFEDWLLRKLHADHVPLVWLGAVRTSYKDVDLYEVTLP